MSSPASDPASAIADAAVRLRTQLGRAPIVGIAGAQGTGKSTLARALTAELADRGLSAVAVSIDDFYLTRRERESLAREVHPLLATRGVPGTHDLPLAHTTLDRLLAAGVGEVVRYPRFDKAIDDRAPHHDWPSFSGPCDVLVLEGWCLDAQPCSHALPAHALPAHALPAHARSPAALDGPINALEREHDADGSHRRYVEAQLAGPYRALFARIDLKVFLVAPDMPSVVRWRTQQEHELAAATPASSPASSSARGSASGSARVAPMDDVAIRVFVQHFERITRTMLETGPARADVVVELGPDHQVRGLRLHGDAAGQAR